MRNFVFFLLILLAVILFSCRTVRLTDNTQTKTDTMVENTVKDTTVQVPEDSGKITRPLIFRGDTAKINLPEQTITDGNLDIITSVTNGMLKVKAKVRPWPITFRGVIRETKKNTHAVVEHKIEKKIEPSFWKKIWYYGKGAIALLIIFFVTYFGFKIFNKLF